MDNVKKPIYLSLIGMGLVWLAFMYPHYDNPEKESALMQTILGGLNQLHFKPVEIDDDFSKKAFSMYLDRIDNGKRWLIQSEVEQLEKFKLELDDQSNMRTYEMFDLSLVLLENGIKRAQDIVNNALAQPFDYNDKSSIQLDDEKRTFPKDEADLKLHWNKSLEYEIISRIHDKVESQEKKKENTEKYTVIEKDGKQYLLEIESEEETEIKDFNTFEIEAREKVQENYDKFFERLHKLKRSDRLETYLNSITNVFDPHTSYYEPKDKASFDIAMSGTLEGIGARLSEVDGYTKVVSIVPGGPAWKGKELEVNDKIVAVAQGEDEPVDVVGMDLQDVITKIRGKKGTEVKLTVKKVDGQEAIVSIVRDIIIIDESFAKSVVLDLEGEVDNIGYIKLPRFYADFQRKNGRSCAPDIAKEIEKLKEKNVEGIILDLRNNGGGSLRDVVKMSGFFIEEGPVVQVKSRNRKPEVLQDSDETVQYDGPLIVMVNTFSASASEILAAALQDYDRAVIVGSKSTFGKGTVQRFVNLDRAFPGGSDVKPLGEVKLTIQKFYRINGGSTQLKGVEPDIVLPDNYAQLDEGEKSHEYAMPWTSIDPVDYSQNVRKVTNLDKLVANSKKRVESNPIFNKIVENSHRYKDSQDETIYPLAYDDYDKKVEIIENEADKFKNIFKDIENLSITNHAQDTVSFEMDEGKKSRNEDWLKSIKKDVYIEECLHIMKEML